MNYYIINIFYKSNVLIIFIICYIFLLSCSSNNTYHMNSIEKEKLKGYHANQAKKIIDENEKNKEKNKKYAEKQRLEKNKEAFEKSKEKNKDKKPIRKFNFY